MLTFTEEILLLLLDDEDGTFVPIPNANLGCAIGGAVLMDLAFAYRIDTDPKALVVNDATPTGNPMLDGTLAKIAAQGSESDTRTWIRVLSVEDAPAIREQALESLVARGIVQVREERVMWAFRTRRYPTIDGNVEQEVKLRIGEVLFSEDIPDPAGRRPDRPGGCLRYSGRDLPRQGHGTVPPAHRSVAPDGPDRPRAGERDLRHRAYRGDGALGRSLLSKTTRDPAGRRGRPARASRATLATLFCSVIIFHIDCPSFERP